MTSTVPEIAAEMVCKFCGWSGVGRACENGSEYDDEGNHVGSTYCGNLECLGCHGCQGNPVTDAWRAAACVTRCIKEHRPVSWLFDRKQR